MRQLVHLILLLALAVPARAAPAQAGPEAPRGAEQARILADMLEDPAAREAIIARLREAAADTPAAGEAAQEPSVVEALARKSQAAAQELADLTGAVTRQLVDLVALLEGDPAAGLEKILKVAGDLALLVVVTLALFFALRFAAVRSYQGLARRAEEAGWLRTLMLLIASSALDALTAVGAWAGGYGFALLTVGEGAVDLSQTLFLNAFLVIEMVKVVLRGVLAPRYGELRLLPMGDETAAYWEFWASRMVSLLGYGMLLVVPLVDERVSAGAGRAVAVLVALTALAMAVVIVLQNRARVRAALAAAAAGADGRIERSLLALLARTWHGLAILYVLAVFTVWLTRPETGLGDMAWASLQSVVAIVIGVVVTGFISRWVTGGVRLPDDLRERLPLLERRLNAYVPFILRVVRLAVMVMVVVAIFQVWGLADVLSWLKAEAGREALLRVIAAFLMVVVALAIYLGVSSWVEYRLNPDVGSVPTSRERTLLALFRNAFSIALVVITVMLVLAQLGMNIGPLLAGAGVLGLAIGFGSQKLVQDVITGVFIQLENAMNTGDVVTVAGITGAVERLTIRSVSLRDLTGVYHVIPFSSADSVSNYMKDFSYHVSELGVAYRENVAQVKQLMQEAFDRLMETEHGEKLIAPLEMHGLTTFGDSAVMVRARLKCVPGAQWAVGRAYNEIVKEIFDERGVEIPFPHVTVYMGEDKEGNAPPLRLAGSAGEPSPQTG